MSVLPVYLTQSIAVITPDWLTGTLVPLIVSGYIVFALPVLKGTSPNSTLNA